MDINNTGWNLRPQREPRTPAKPTLSDEKRYQARKALEQKLEELRLEKEFEL